MDRIDLHIEVPSVQYRDLARSSPQETSARIKDRVLSATARQKARFGQGITHFNARMSDRQIKQFCKIDEDSQKLLEMAVDKLGRSARAYTRILKTSRTIADLEQAIRIRTGETGADAL